jgi:hypothetical protein
MPERKARMKTMVRRGWAVGFAVSMALAITAGLWAQDEKAIKAETFGAGRIIRADGTKVIVSSFVIEERAVAYLLKNGEEALSLDLDKVASLQVRVRPTLGRSVQGFFLGAAFGGIVSLLASSSWGGPTKSTWPAIGAATAACALAYPVFEWTVRRYKTVYTRSVSGPGLTIEGGAGIVAPGAAGLRLSIRY